MTGTKYVFDAGPSESLSETVIYGVAEVKGVDPIELSDCLYDCIEPDALDKLFRPAGPDTQGTVAFTMSGCYVEVESGGRVTVEPVGGDGRRVETEIHA